MHPAYEAALNVARESFAMLGDALDGLPPEALGWKPAPSANGIGVLVVHSITATLFWMGAGSGQQRSIAEYRSGDRAASFEAQDRSTDELRAAISDCLEELERVLGDGSEATLQRVVEWPEVEDAPRVTGYECLGRAIGHLREHAGQAQLTRDLWLAQSDPE